jgi:hypothetical protein
MNLLTENQLKQVSAGACLPVVGIIPYQGEHTFTDGFWNGAATFAPTVGYIIGSFAGFVLYPLELLGYFDINSHLPPKNNNTAA